MQLDYTIIGKNIARRRRKLGFTQAEIEEKADLGQKYLSQIERAKSIPSIEVVMRLAAALDTTPDEFLVGAARNENEEWRSVAELLRKMDGKQLDLARSFLTWLTGQTL